jgi:hypothetical protein
MYDKPLAVRVFLSLLVGLVVVAGVYAIIFFGPNTYIYLYLGESAVLVWWFICGPILAILGGLFAVYKVFKRL